MLVRHGHWGRKTKIYCWRLKWSATGESCTFTGIRKSQMWRCEDELETRGTLYNTSWRGSSACLDISAGWRTSDWWRVWCLGSWGDGHGEEDQVGSGWMTSKNGVRWTYSQAGHKWPASLRILSSKAGLNTWESFTRSELKLESVHKVTTLRHLQEKGYQTTSETSARSILPELRRKITGLLLSGPKSSFQMKVDFVFHLEIKVPESRGRVESHRIHVAWSPVWSFHSHWWFGVPWHLLVLVHCVFWSSTVNAVIYQEILEHFMLTSFMEMLISFSSRTWHLPTLPKVPKAGSITMVLQCLIGQQTRLSSTP